MNKKLYRDVGLCASAVVLTLVTVVGLAAPTDSVSPAEVSQDDGLPEIRVTAAKRDERLQDVPLSVTAISGDTIGQVALQVQADLPKVTPNLVVLSGASFVAPYLRGVGTQYSNVGAESEVGVYLDDVYLRSPESGLLNTPDLARVEVLKGPQGTLYGRNTTGGAIRFITNDPSPDWEASGSVVYGNYNRIESDGVLNVPVSSKLFFRLTAEHDQRDGYVRSSSGGPDLENRNIDVVRAKLLWEPSDAVSVKFSGNYTHKHDYDGASAVLAGTQALAPYRTAIMLGATDPIGFYLSPQNVPEPFDVKETVASFRVDYKLESLTLSSITGFDHEIYHSGDPVGFDIDGSELPLESFLQSPVDDASYSQEFQAVSTGNGPFKYTVGTFLFHETASTTYGVFGDFISTSGAFLFGHEPVNTNSFAPYAEATYDFNDQFALTAGARYTIESKELDEGTVGLSDAYTLGSPTYTVYNRYEPETIRFKKLTPKVTFSYKPNSENLLYATYSEGFKSGAIQAPFTGFTGTPNITQPETLRDFEIGEKYTTNTVRLNVALFDYDYSNIQVQTNDPLTGANEIENAASSRIYGLDGDAAWKATQWLELGGGVGLLHAKFTKFPNASFYEAVNDITPSCHLPPLAAVPAALNAAYLACAGYTTVVANVTGNTLPYAPKFTGYGRVTVTQPVAGGGSVAGTLNGNYTSQYFAYANDGLAYDSRFLLNGNITWTINNHYSVAVFGDNLTNKRYFTSQTLSTLGGWDEPAAPRMYYLRLSGKY